MKGVKSSELGVVNRSVRAQSRIVQFNAICLEIF